MYLNRLDAAQQLAKALQKYRGQHPLVLAIARGAVPMGLALAKALDGSFDVVLVRKLCAPLQPELAIGSVDETGLATWLPKAATMGLEANFIRAEIQRQMKTLKARQKQYRQVLPRADVKDRLVIVVDDGLATGATMIAALHGLRQSKPAKLVCAVPVAPADTLARVADLADEVLCLHQPTDFEAVGQFYRHFPQVSDDEVLAVLRQSAPVRMPPPMTDSRPQATAR